MGRVRESGRRSFFPGQTPLLDAAEAPSFCAASPAPSERDLRGCRMRGQARFVEASRHGYFRSHWSMLSRLLRGASSTELTVESARAVELGSSGQTRQMRPL